MVKDKDYRTVHFITADTDEEYEMLQSIRRESDKKIPLLEAMTREERRLARLQSRGKKKSRDDREDR